MCLCVTSEAGLQFKILVKVAYLGDTGRKAGSKIYIYEINKFPCLKKNVTVVCYTGPVTS